ncbi:hypothetical protein ABVK25_007476 [Lepraria finkii]|uniref:Uncharacterized protein n=1 Tax=Lepraria finkii TaxID=1340010 RepID=A0ABR4B349_9LECA
MASATDQESPEGSTGASWTPLSRTYMANTNENGGSGPTIAGNGSPLQMEHLQLVMVFQAPMKTQILAQLHLHLLGGLLALTRVFQDPLRVATTVYQRLEAAILGRPSRQAHLASADLTTVTMTTQYTVTILKSLKQVTQPVPPMLRYPVLPLSTVQQRLRRLPSMGQCQAALLPMPLLAADVRNAVKSLEPLLQASSGIGSLYGIGTQGGPLERVAISPKVPIHLLRRLPLSPLPGRINIPVQFYEHHLQY